MRIRFRVRVVAVLLPVAFSLIASGRTPAQTLTLGAPRALADDVDSAVGDPEAFDPPVLPDTYAPEEEAPLLDPEGDVWDGNGPLEPLPPASPGAAADCYGRCLDGSDGSKFVPLREPRPRRLGPPTCDGDYPPPYTLDYFGSDWNYGVPVLNPFWVGAEYLGWAMKSADLPALVTTSPLNTPPDLAGVPGEGATILFGDTTIHKKLRSGGRLRGGFWLTPARVHGFEGSYFGVDGHDVEYFAAGAGDSVIARPYLDAVSGAPASVLTAYPGLQDGAVHMTADLEFSGAEALYRYVFRKEPYRQYELLLGYRYGRLFDQFRSDEVLVSLDEASGFPTDAIVERTDLFKAVNQFHGGQAGLQTRWALKRGFALTMLGKAALGASTTRFHVNGSTVVSEPEVNSATGLTEYFVTETYDGGVLAQPTNSGTFRSNELAFLGELGVSLEYVWNQSVRLSFGYTLLYWTDVARAARHIDTTVNPTQFPPADLEGPARPDFRFSLEDFWAQGMNAGIEIDF